MKWAEGTDQGHPAQRSEGLALFLDMPSVHLLKLEWVHGPASLLGLGDITSAWSPKPLSVESKRWLFSSPLRVTLRPWDLALLSH